MSAHNQPAARDLLPLDEAGLSRRIASCRRLGSLRRINERLTELANAEESFTREIATVVSRDPVLTTGILRLVNTIFFGLAHRITNIEDAVFVLGLRQIRELALATPVIEDMDVLCRSARGSPVDWTPFWRHSVGVAMLTRQVLTLSPHAEATDSDYLLGLLHNVGHMVAAHLFPERFLALAETAPASVDDLLAFEQRIYGWDHTRLGAEFLIHHQLPSAIVEPVRLHHDRDPGGTHALRSAAVQLASLLVRGAGVSSIFQLPPPAPDAWKRHPSAARLFGNAIADPDAPQLKPLRDQLAKLPQLLKNLV